MGDLSRSIQFLGGPEGYCKKYRSSKREAGWPEKQGFVVHHAIDREFTLLGDEEPLRRDIADTKDEKIEETLRAGTDVFWKHSVYIYIDSGEEEGVTDAMKKLHGNDRPDLVREICKDEEARRVTEDAKDKGDAPA